MKKGEILRLPINLENFEFETIRINLKEKIKKINSQGKDDSELCLNNSKMSQPAVCEGCEEEKKNCTGVYMECIKKR